MQATVSIKTHYGTQYIYPVCQTAQHLANLTGKKTFSHRDIDTIKALGYSINVQQPQVTLWTTPSHFYMLSFVKVTNSQTQHTKQHKPLMWTNQSLKTYTTPENDNMTRKDYELIAAILRAYANLDKINEVEGKTNRTNDLLKYRLECIVDSFANVLGSESPRFNRETFIKACQPWTTTTQNSVKHGLKPCIQTRSLM